MEPEIEQGQKELLAKRAEIKQSQGNMSGLEKNLIAPEKLEKQEERKSPCTHCGVDVKMRYLHWKGEWITVDLCPDCQEKVNIEKRNVSAQREGDSIIKKINEYLQARAVARRFISASMSDFPKAYMELTKSEKGLFLTGPRGTGKTHLAVAIMREMFLDGVKSNIEYVKTLPTGRDISMHPRSSIFITVPELLMQIREAFGERARYSEKKIIEEFADVNTLFLDDLGAEKTTEWSMQTLFLIIDRRYRDMKKTIITSNLSIEEIANTIGDRIASRIIEMCDVKVIKGEDRRLKR